MKEKGRKEQDGVVKVKPHVCKRSLTSASALYSFLTAARIPAVGLYGEGVFSSRGPAHICRLSRLFSLSRSGLRGSVMKDVLLRLAAVLRAAARWSYLPRGVQGVQGNQGFEHEECRQ
ncbi:hypothetical protein KUCAC02_005885 [Chaenocephalus aceratus]|uniref:Uncharacterized protein n=1 Tax=Chaenocephalus aceratus TaxID=36190 RepID=A0ACB9WPW4_CHAAC|nr:hypothetical protein KUCAC02_005885 [Chaenocephalus aceratus]